MLLRSEKNSQNTERFGELPKEATYLIYILHKRIRKSNLFFKMNRVFYEKKEKNDKNFIFISQQ